MDRVNASMRQYLHPKSALVVLATLLFALAFSAQTFAKQTGGGGSTVKVQPIAPTLGFQPNGLVVVLKTHDLKDTTSWHKALDNPSISGVALQIHWADIEPFTDTPDWSKLDALFAAAQKSKKWVHLLMFPGFFTPAWAERGAKTDTFQIQYGPGQGQSGILPMPWDSTYLTNWLTFVKEVSDRYGSSPAFRLVAVAGPTSVSDEATLPKNSEDLKKWENDGYTPSKYVAAWKKVLEAYAEDFPSQYVSLSVGQGVDILDLPGQRNSTDGGSQTRLAIVNAAMTRLGRRFAIQMSDVHAGPGSNGSTSQTADQFIIGYNGRAVTGFQMGGSMEGAVGSRKGGAAGDPPRALQKSIELATEPNSAGRIVNYVEIYEADVLPLENQKVLSNEALLCFLGPSTPHGLCVPPATVPPGHH